VQADLLALIVNRRSSFLELFEPSLRDPGLQKEEGD